MSRPTRRPEMARVPAPTAICNVKFKKKLRRGKFEAGEQSIGRVPRVARLLALAYRIDGMIRSGELKNWTEAARLVGITRPRMTQIANLMLLAPALQEPLFLLPIPGATTGSLTEHVFRPIAALACWHAQEALCEPLPSDRASLPRAALPGASSEVLSRGV